jgi:anti-sigma-K factor RskA
MSNNHPWTEFAASYALGALDPEEKARFEAHLADCPICRAEVRAYEEVTGHIGYAAPSVVAPPKLKQRVLSKARKVRPISGPTPAAGRVSVGRHFSGLLWLATAAMLILSLGIGFLYTRERNARVAAENDAQDALTRLANTRVEIAQRDSLMDALLTPDLQTAVLASRGRPPAVRIWYNPSRKVVVLAANDLPPVPPNRTYQLWGMVGQQPVSLGTFNTRNDGRAVVLLPVDSPTRPFTSGAITEEPLGGSTQPTMQPFLLGRWGTAP